MKHFDANYNNSIYAVLDNAVKRAAEILSMFKVYASDDAKRMDLANDIVKFLISIDNEYSRYIDWALEVYTEEGLNRKVMDVIHTMINLPSLQSLAKDCIAYHTIKTFGIAKYYGNANAKVSYIVKKALLAKDSIKTPLDTEMIIFEYLPTTLSFEERKSIAYAFADVLWKAEKKYHVSLDDGEY